MRRLGTPPLALLAFAATAAALATGVDLQGSDTPRAPRPEAATRAPQAVLTPPPPDLPRAALDRQDQVSRAHRRREALVDDRRPLLKQLPLELAGVTIDLAGLTPDRNALVTIAHPRRSRRHAHAVYRHALTVYGDSGRAYTVRYLP